MITAILMASGFSKRMNTNKLLLDFKGKPMVEHIMSAISKCHFDEQLLIAKDEQVMHLSSQYQFKLVKNSNAHRGQSESIHLGVSNAKKGNAYMFFVADQPFLSVDTIMQLINAHKSNPAHIIIPSYNGNNKNPTIFPASFSNELLSLDGDVGGRAVIKNNPERIYTLAINDRLSFVDIDTLKSYEQMR